MKKDIHPKYNSNIKATCVCGNNFETGSTLKEIKTELCSNCHPFYTGKQKLVDSSRRVEKFQAKVESGKKVSATRKGKKVKRAKRDKERSKKEVKVKVKKDPSTSSLQKGGQAGQAKKDKK